MRTVSSKKLFVFWLNAENEDYALYVTRGKGLPSSSSLQVPLSTK